MGTGRAGEPTGSGGGQSQTLVLGVLKRVYSSLQMGRRTLWARLGPSQVQSNAAPHLSPAARQQAWKGRPGRHIEQRPGDERRWGARSGPFTHSPPGSHLLATAISGAPQRL